MPLLRLSSPGRSAHSSPATKAASSSSSALLRPSQDAAAIVCRLLIAIEAAVVADPATARKFIMANIGSFKKSGNEFQGEIVTLSVQTKNVRIVPETSRTSDNAPSHRVLVGRIEIGAGWSKRSNEGRDYISVKLDDPSFNVPIYANLFGDEGGDGFTLIWSRARRSTGE